MQDNNNKKISRSQQREQAFCLLFEASFCRDADAEQLNEIYDNAVRLYGYADTAYIKTAFFGTVNDQTAIDGIISKYSEGWRIDRISHVSLSIMRLCLYEAQYIEDVPINVALNEAVELCKKYDTDEAPAFINGVLNAAIKGENIK